MHEVNHHTQCHRCIKQLIRNNKLQCPECKKKHKVTNGEKTFPQNKYILVNVGMKNFQIQDEPEILKKCEEHGKELMFLCQEIKCKKPICPIGLVRDHAGHKVVKLEEMEKEEKVVLITKFDAMKQSLERKKRTLMKTTEEIVNKNKTCVSELEKQKEEIVKKFNGMIRSTETSTGIDEASKIIDENLTLIETMRENITTGAMNHDAVTKKRRNT